MAGDLLHQIVKATGINASAFVRSFYEIDFGGGQGGKESTPIKVWVTPEEKVAIAAKADVELFKRIQLLAPARSGAACESTIDQRAILDLVKINADLGRFGDSSKCG